jgi:hypothetical protein
MPIVAGEILWKKPDEDSDASSNGGRLTYVVSPTDVANNEFPNLSQAELTAGLTRYRKRYLAIANNDDIQASAVELYMRKHSPADDSVTFFPGTQRDTQTDLTGTERQYGAGQLATDVTAGGTTLVVNTEGVALDYFKDGDTILVSDKTSATDPSNNRENATITGAPSYSGDQATITITAGLTNSYLAANTVVSSIYNAGNVNATEDNYAVVSAAGTYDDTTYPVTVDHVGTVEQTWTVTFTSATAFGVVGDTIGSVGSGVIGSDFTPVNADEGEKYFTILSAGWGGTWAASDTFSFQTHPCAVPVWFKQVVAAATAAFSSNNPVVAVRLQTA